jgi:hypothetical protein
MLSRALHLTRLQARRHRDVWIADSAAHWFEELGLSRREQEAARRDLLALGVWEERIAGMPSSLFARVRLEVLAARLGGRSEGFVERPQRSDAVGGNATSNASPNVETRVRRSHSLVSTKPPSLIRRNRHQCSDETAILHKEQSTGDSLQPQNTVSPPAGEPPLSAAVGGGEALIFPDRLLPQERDAAQRLLSQVADQPMALLDDLQRSASVVALEDSTRHKPDPEPIERALAHLGASTRAAVYVGDSPHDLLAGRRAGVVTAAAAWGPFDHDTLRAEAPDLWLDAPTQLLRLLEV